MSGLSFLFFPALFALPVVVLPILLHLLFRRKSPIVEFSTLRFIRASIQRTAARKRVQRWLLLACRALLLGLLVWAVAQPARKLGAGWAGHGKALVAAVVVDTSYSMQLQEREITLLSKADAVVNDLLRDPLRDARVAVFKSTPPADGPEQLKTASRILSEWTPLAPQPAPRPLVERITAAADLLQRERADEKWLVVVSDFQSREFPHPPGEFKDGKTVFIDLRPQDPRSDGVTRISVEPRLMIPGLPREIVVEVAGRSGDTRSVEAALTALDGRVLSKAAVKVANFDSSGHAKVRFPVTFPPERWILIKASLQGDDALAWDNQRFELVEVPPRQVVCLLDAPALQSARRVVSLALDPSEGQMTAWPVALRAGPELAPDATVAVLLCGEWPDQARATRLQSFVNGGGTLIWFTKPGLEVAWGALPDAQKAALLPLLPSAPLRDDNIPDASVASIASMNEPVLEGLTDPAYELNKITLLRYVPFSVTEPPTSAILNASPRSPVSRARPHGVLFRRPLGAGTVFTFATLPESQYGNLATHPLLLPMLVGMALRPPARGDAQNVELGDALFVAGSKYDNAASMTVEGPQNDVTAVQPTTSPAGRRFVFDHADAPGRYGWSRPGGGEVVAMGNVQMPSAEAELSYRGPETLAEAGPGVVIGKSVGELQSRLSQMNEPEPQWSSAVALVLLLLCVEALLGSTNKIWKPPSLRAFLPRFGAAPNSL